MVEKNLKKDDKKVITAYYFSPVSEHGIILLNSVPKGSGFLRMNDILGKPLILVFLGHQADIDSSKSLITDTATTFFLFSLNSKISLDAMYHGS
jgi:hypothetical protein